MGYYVFTDATTKAKVTVEYTFGYKRCSDGKPRIFLHHSSVPYNGGGNANREEWLKQAKEVAMENKDVKKQRKALQECLANGAISKALFQKAEDELDARVMELVGVGGAQLAEFKTLLD